MERRRYRRILWFFARVLIAAAWWDIFLPAVGLRRLSARGRSQRYRRAAASFRQLAVQMGGVLIKVGQFLSARLDVLPPEIIQELADLQDEVQPEDFTEIRRVAESELQAPLEERYAWFDPQPLAAASIGQVHAARLRWSDENGERELPVVVKVQRPQIEAVVKVDLAALRVVAGWVHRYPPLRKHVNLPALLQEFSQSLFEEIQYLHEGKNAETFAAHFAGRADVRVPQVYWSHTTQRVLTLEDVRGIKITDYAAIEAAGIPRSEVSVRLFNTYLQQIFEDRFFHADPHPGNLFIQPGPQPADGSPRPWTLVFVDFGMVGTISPNVLDGLREGLFAVVTRDGARVVKAYQILGVLLPNADLELLEQANNRVFDRFWGKTSPEIMEMKSEEALEFMQEFSGLLYEMPFQLPENFILLGRCLAILSGICTGLDAEFNLWTSVAPYGEKLMRSEGGQNWKTWLSEAGKILQTAVGLPMRADALISRLEQGKLEVRTPDLRTQLARLERSQRRTAAAVVFAAFLLTAAQLYLAGSLLLAGLAAGGALMALISLLLFP